jgi:chromosome partitioning related protein ParA
MSFNVCVVSTKGGVGKTTLSVNLSAYLAQVFGQRVLLVDADPQPTASSYFNLLELAPYGLTEFIAMARLDEVISRTAIDNLDLIYSNDPDGKLRDWVRDAVDGRVRLKHRLAQLNDRYDVVMIDTQGAIGPLQDAAVAAAQLLLSPIPPEILPAREFLRGTVAMLERLSPMAYLGAPIGPLRGVIYKADRTVDARTLIEAMRSASFLPGKGALSILETVVPSAVAYRDAATRKLPVHQFDGRQRAVIASLVAELFPQLIHADVRDPQTSSLRKVS